MFFKSYLPKQYLATAIVAFLLQGVVTAAPVFAEPAAKSKTTSVQTDMAEQNTIDHSAESKPIQNEFLKEGEGIPGTEVPYQNERKLAETRGVFHKTRKRKRSKRESVCQCV